MCVSECGAERQACGVVQQHWEESQKHPTAEEIMVQSPITHTHTHAHTFRNTHTEREARILSGECKSMLRRDVRREEELEEIKLLLWVFKLT